MRRPFIAGNWKMNLERSSILDLLGALKEILPSVSEVDVGVFPSFPYIPLAVEALEGTGVVVGGQDLYFESKGAYTGQVSADMLIDIAATHVLIGHSERRHVFGDTDETVRKKVAAALQAGLKPVLCVGELLPEREAGRTNEVVLKQTEKGLDGFSSEELGDLVVAYEPVWAIGTGVTATPEQAGEAHRMIREWFGSFFSPDFADKLRILYGGSVKPDNVDLLMADPDIDGTLVGGASLKPELFNRIVGFNR